jgi:hypothetical protein
VRSDTGITIQPSKTFADCADPVIAARRPMRRKIYRQATDEDGGRRDENRKIYSVLLSITS